MKNFFIFVFIVLVFSCLTGCTTIKYIPVETVKCDTVWENHTTHDSIYVVDSVFLHMWHAGDTVYMEKTKWKTKFVERLKMDTVYISKRDTVIQAGKPLDTGDGLSWWDRARIWIGNIVLLAAFAAAAIWFYKVFK